MKVKHFVVIRAVAWALAAGAVGAVMFRYDSLPATIPVTRWTAAPKSLFIALRVPIINLMTMGLVELVLPGLRRVKGFDRADAVVAVLLLTAAAKAVIEAAGILMLPVSISWTMMPLVAVLSLGIGTAAYLGRELLQPGRWRELQMTRLEITSALALVIVVVALNLPLFVR